MNREKQKNYCNNETVVGIHTGSGVTEENVNLMEVEKNGNVPYAILRKVRNQERYEVFMKINPNPRESGYILEHYSEFKKVIQEVWCDLEVDSFQWKRIDLSFNTRNNSYYKEYKKLNRLLIACFANMTSAKNVYDAKDFWTCKTKSLVAKSENLEIEFYDKEKESGGKSPYYSRLELRSVRIRKGIEHEFLELWMNRLDAMVLEFENVQARYNDNLAQIYLEDLGKEKRDRKFNSVTNFLTVYRECIFTRNQLKELLILIGMEEKQAKRKVYNFSKNHNIEFFAKKDLEYIVKDIQAKIREYFSK